MKRTFAKQSLMSLLAGFFLFGMLSFMANRAEAQQSYIWKQSDDAKQALGVQIKNLHGSLQSLQGGALQDALVHVYYYKQIYLLVDQGKDTEAASHSALEIFDVNANNSQGFTRPNTMQDVTIQVDKTKKATLLVDARSFLATPL